MAKTLVVGETVSSVARRHELNPSMLFGWRKRYGGISALAAPPASMDFVPVSIALSEASETGRARERPVDDPVIELDFESGARLRVFSTAAPQLVRTVVKTMTRR